MNTNQLRDASEVALAAYGQFESVGRPAKDGLVSLNGDVAGFALSQADRFANRFTVALPTFNDAISLGGSGSTSFDATVLIGKDSAPGTGNNNEIHIALRGTQQRAGSPNDLAASYGILSEGAAIEQIIAMHNWYRRISAVPGQSVAQFGIATFAIFEPVPPEYVLIRADDTIRQYIYRLPDITASGELSAFLAADPDRKVTVSGSSLGGHLAMAFAALFPEQTSQAYAFNSPGFADNFTVNGLFSALGASRPTSGNGLITNVTSSEANNAGSSLELIAGLWGYPGQQVTVPIENQFNSDVADPKFSSWNHDQRQVTDALALYALLQGLDPTFSLSAQNALTRSAASGETRSIENLVDALEQWVGLGSAPLPAGNEGMNAQSPRSVLHAAVQALEGNASYTVLKGKVRITPSTKDLAASARNDFNAVVSLLTLSPFVMKGSDAANQSLLDTVLEGVWGSIYSGWQADKNMSTADRNAGKEAFTQKWYDDRAALLGYMLDRNTRNFTNEAIRTSTYGSNAYWYDYRDAAGAQQRINVVDKGWSGSAGDDQRIRVSFGDEANNLIVGGKRDDRLYGGSGLDQLNGGDGDDYLEGGSDFDSLYGEKQNDTLVGGAGDDWLEGGQGTDMLIGGTGIDSYRFSAGFGNDTIIDAGGQGDLKYAGVALTGGKRVPGLSGVWEDAQREYVYTLQPNAQGGSDLLIGRRTAAGSATIEGTITVRGWVNGELGITLEAAETPVTPTTATYDGSFVKKLKPDGVTYEIVSGNYVPDGADPEAPDLIIGAAAADWLRSGAGNDGLVGNGGDDLIEGGGGSDVLLGGAGADRILGGAGNDFIDGSGAADAFVRPTKTTTAPPAASGPELARGFGWVVYDPAANDGNNVDTYVNTLFTNGVAGDSPNYIDAGVGDDVVNAGTGNDFAVGGEGNDKLVGMAGADVLLGDAGDDTIEGDGIVLPGYGTSTAPADHGDDLLFGGEGNDSLVGGGGNDQLYGQADNDLLFGDSSAGPDSLHTDVPGTHHGHDYLDGGAGNDELSGGGGNDELLGGDGNDLLDGDRDASRLEGQYHGNDRLDGGGGDDQLLGAGGADVIVGGSGNDLIYGDDNTIPLPIAFHGADVIDAGDGNDRAFGNGGDDLIDGGAGDDQLFGGEGSDTLLGGSGADQLDGGQGDDLAYGDEGNDALLGGEGDDALYGDTGNDTILAGAGSDVVIGGTGADYMSGQAGNDTYLIAAGDAAGQAGQFDTIDDNEGSDTLVLEGVSRAGVTAVMAAHGTLGLAFGANDGVLLIAGLQSSIETVMLADGAVSLGRLVVERLSTPVQSRSTRAGATVFGGTGADALEARHAGATLMAGRGSDSLSVLTSEGATIDFAQGDGFDQLTAVRRVGGGGPGGSPENTLQLGEGFNAADATLVSTGGNGYALLLNASGDGIRFAAGDGINPADPADWPIDRLLYADGTVLNWQALLARGIAAPTTAATEGDDSIILAGQPDVIYALGGNDTVRGGEGDDRLYGGSGADTIDGEIGADLLVGEVGNDSLIGSAGDDALEGGEGDDRLIGDNYTTVVPEAQHGHDRLDGGRGNDVLVGGGGDDNLVGGDGNDQLMGDSSVANGDHNQVNLTAHGRDWLDGGDGDDLLGGGGRDDVLVGGAGNDVLWGDQSPGTQEVVDYLPDFVDFSGNDLLEGGTGNDLLYGGRGVDSLFGGSGNDRLAGEAGDDQLSGGDGDDWLYGGDEHGGSSGNDLLEGGAGADIVFGGDGYDTYRFGFGSEEDRIVNNNGPYGPVDALGQTPDVVELGAGVSANNVSLIRAGSALILFLAGTEDRLIIEDYFDGQQPSNYAVEEILFKDGERWTLQTLADAAASSGAPAPVAPLTDVVVFEQEEVSIRIPAEAFRASELGGVLSYAVTLADGAPLPSWMGFDDRQMRLFAQPWEPDVGTYTVRVTATSAAGQSASAMFDVVAAIRDLTLAGTDESDDLIGRSGNDQLFGMAGSDYLAGGAGNDWLDGGADADAMYGGAGNDTYLVDNAGDGVYELSNEGTDTVLTSLTLTLPSDAENLTLTGSGSIDGTGNNAANVLLGNAAPNVLNGGAGNDTLDGGAGADMLVGGTGNDTYAVDNVADVVTEGTNAGTDTVLSSVSWTLSGNVENLNLTGTGAINAAGNTLNNTLRGNGANNVLSGGSGSDIMIGGTGDDSYVVDAAGDVVTEAVGEGTDLVQAGVTYTLSANIEILTLTGTTAINGTGNALDNLLTGNSANNRLTGGAGNDTLDGGTGNDTMVGGTGDDTYVVNIATDVVTELANEGTDTVRSGVTLTLGANVENLVLTGTTAVNGTGNALDNVLTGNSGANTLTGGAGNDTLDGGPGTDTLVGGAGNDTFVVDATTDVTTEAANEGTDAIRSSVTWTLGTNLENLTLLGAAALNGTGNGSNNMLTGNAGANTLTGAAGNDTLDGAAGNDLLIGGAGSDSYVFGRGWGLDTIQENDATAGVVDQVLLGAGIVQTDTSFVRVGNNLELSVLGATDKLVMQNWYLGSQYQVEQFRYSDGTTTTNSQVAGLLSAMASFGAEAAAETAPKLRNMQWKHPEYAVASI